MSTIMIFDFFFNVPHASTYEEGGEEAEEGRKGEGEGKRKGKQKRRKRKGDVK